MVNPHFHFSFKVDAWRALSGKMADEAQWRQWAAQPECAALLPDYVPSAAFLPALKRRRLNTAAKLICEAAWDLSQDFGQMPLVYGSHDGEINRSFELWQQLLREDTVSPTSFGLSVHNAQPGQWSILTGDTSEQTALAAAEDGLETALAECYALLCEGAPRVLLVLADDPLSRDYDVQTCRAPWPYALAMVVSAGADYTLSCHAAEHEAQADECYWGALNWIRFMLSDGLSAQQHYGRRVWHWQKNHEPA